MRRPRPPNGPHRRAVVAVLLSVVFPGLGQFYNGSHNRGFAVWGALTITFAVTTTHHEYGVYALVAVWLYSVVAAYVNSETAPV